MCVHTNVEVHISYHRYVLLHIPVTHGQRMQAHEQGVPQMLQNFTSHFKILRNRNAIQNTSRTADPQTLGWVPLYLSSLAPPIRAPMHTCVCVCVCVRARAIPLLHLWAVMVCFGLYLIFTLYSATEVILLLIQFQDVP